jgi:Peptidase family M28
MDRLLAHVTAMAGGVTDRHAGGPGERAATEYIAAQMGSIGLDVEVIDVPVMGWEVTEEPQLELLDLGGRCECAPFIFSGSTPPEGLLGTLRPLGKSVIAGGFEWAKYAIVDDDGQWRGFVVGRPDGPAIAQVGPPAGLAGAADVPLYTWPACVVGETELSRIQEAHAAGDTVRVRYRCQARFDPQATSSVIKGELIGTSEPDEVIIVGSHHDSQGAAGFPSALRSPGANDNASAVAIFLELARMYVASPPAKTLWFCVFGGEERNLMLSREFARRLVDTGELDRVIAYIGIDQAAYGHVLRLLASADEPHVQPRLNLREMLTDVARELEVAERFDTYGPGPVHAASDHWPFYYAGVPAFLTGWHPFDGYHRSTDSVDRIVDEAQYLATADLAFGMLESTLQSGPHGRQERGITPGLMSVTAQAGSENLLP